jgi:hydroxymethylglutaryl-CoA synthase
VPALKINPMSHAADLEFACKAGTAAMQIVMSMVQAKQIKYGLAIGSDTAQGKPGDALEYSAASGAAAFLIGSSSKKHPGICSIDATLSYTTDTPDFWRNEGEAYPKHAGRFTGEPAYFHHIEKTTKAILEKTKLKASDINHVVFHMPNGKFPLEAAKRLGFSKEQMELGFIVPMIGNTYSACSPLGLTFVLEKAEKDEKILLVSYGSGAGSDAFVITILQDGKTLPMREGKNEYVSYHQYMQQKEQASC